MGGGASREAYRCEANASSTRKPRERPTWLMPASQKLASLKDFSNLRAIGKGKFGLVYLCKQGQGASGKCVAIKYITKAMIHETQCLVRLNQEVQVLQQVDHPFLVHCFGGFETPECIALVCEYAMGGELYTYMKKNNKMREDHARFYLCEIALGLTYLHDKLGIIYRDLKPENVLLDYAGHVKLCDFGFALPFNSDSAPLQDGCGTAMYVAPEIAGGFFKKAHGFPVDWWSLGCVLAEMVTGHAPFGDTDHASKFEVFTNITENSPSLSMSMSSSCRTLVKGLLEKDPAKRLSWQGLKASDFVKDVNWGDLLSKQVVPPWQPEPNSEPSTDNFVSWNDLRLPTSPPDAAAAAYCRNIALPRLRTSVNSNGIRDSSHLLRGGGGEEGKVPTPRSGSPVPPVSSSPVANVKKMIGASGAAAASSRKKSNAGAAGGGGGAAIASEKRAPGAPR